MSGSRLKVLRRTYSPPQPGDSRYVRVVEQTLGLQVLNGQKRVVRRIVVSGMALTLDAGDSTGLLERTRGGDDVAEVVIVGDTVAINMALTFPGAHVSIYARSLSFGNEQSFVDTAPPLRPARDPRIINGRDGLPAGAITVVVGEFHPASSTAKHFRAVGGAGEPADDGGLVPGTGNRMDVKPLAANDWAQLMSPSHRRLEHEEVLWQEGYVATFPEIPFDQVRGRASMYGGTLTYAEINNSYYKDNFHINTSSSAVVASIGSKDLPGRGADAARPGRPGTGGAGGTFEGVAAAAASFQGEGGQSGSQRPSSPGGPGGSPTQPVWVFIEGRPDGSNHNISTRYEVKDRAATGASSAPGPPPTSPTGAAGTVVSPQGAAAQGWVNGTSVATVLGYAHDALSANDWTTALTALQPYLAVFAPRAGGVPSLDETTLAALAAQMPGALGSADSLTVSAREVVAVAKAAQDSLDEYGNPVGWAPSVSLDTAVDVYSAVLDSAINQLNLSYTLQHAWSTVSQRGRHLDSMIASLAAASEQARKDLVEARSALVDVDARGSSPLRELDSLLAQSNDKAKQLTDRLQELKAEADKEEAADEVKKGIAAGLKIGGAFVKAIPLPEPYQTIAGGIGTLSETTSQFVDQGASDAAFDTLQSKVKEFTDRDDLADAFTTDLDTAMGTNDKRSADLKEQAVAVADELEKLKTAGDETSDAEAASEKADAAVDAVGSSGGATAKANAATAKAALVTKQQDLEAQQTHLEKANKTLAATKEERAQTVKTAAAKIQQVATGVAEIGKAINELAVYGSELDSRWTTTLAQIEEKDDQLASIKRDIDYLNARKRAVAVTIKKYERQMAKAAETINRNAVALVELRAQYAHTSDDLDAQALAYIQAAQRDAQRALVQFLYYVVKAYEYYTVQPWGNSQYSMVNQIFNKLGALLAGSKDANATTIDPDDLKTLKGVYEAPLVDMARQLAQSLMTGQAGRQDVTVDHVAVGPSVLAELNASLAGGSTGAATLNPAALGWLDVAKQRQRIRSIAVESVSARKLGDAPLPDRIVFTFVHSGQSIVRADGCLFAFVASDHRPEAPLQPSVTWETRASAPAAHLWTQSGDADTYQLAAGSLAVSAPGDEGNLLSKLLKDSQSALELAKLTRFRPGGFSDLELLVEVSPASARLEVTDLVVTVEQEAATDTTSALVCVFSNVDGSVPVSLSRPDRSGTNFGTCNLYAIFDRGDLSANPIQLTVPPEFVGRPFSRWVIDGSPAPTANRSASVTVKQSCQAVAEYAPS